MKQIKDFLEVLLYIYLITCLLVGSVVLSGWMYYLITGNNVSVNLIYMIITGYLLCLFLSFILGKHMKPL